MTARDLVFGAIRRALGVTGAEAPRRKAVEDRLRDHPRGVVPKRGQLGTAERIALFVSKDEAVSGTSHRIASLDELHDDSSIGNGRTIGIDNLARDREVIDLYA